MKKYLLWAHKECLPGALELDLNVESDVTIANLKQFLRKVEGIVPNNSAVNVRVRIVVTKTKVKSPEKK
jgi:hypothetical protein